MHQSIGFGLSLLLGALLMSSVRSGTVTLQVFSGSEDPQWAITKAQEGELERLLEQPKVFRKHGSYRVMGYRGFLVTLGQEGREKEVWVHDAPQVEDWLLDTRPVSEDGIDSVPSQVLEHVRAEIKTRILEDTQGVCSETGQTCGVGAETGEMLDPCCSGSRCFCESPSVCMCKSLFEEEKVSQSPRPIPYLKRNIKRERFEKDVCDETPIRGPDSIPDFDPATDDNGCFKKRCGYNNCYNYGNDIVTNTFAQPGEGTGAKWKVNTCEDVTRAAESDGLMSIPLSLTQGNDMPPPPKKGHLVALFIWPGTNFHWARQDSNGLWSHKPGGTPVSNTDNTGKVIKDASQAELSPWSKFCGYFSTTPSEVKIE
uniref:Uncharacterized protein n=1 Tax=Chromera velia CCMP2878 TaxID=1169474 RepID=A0A0G4GJH7_9ALVE